VQFDEAGRHNNKALPAGLGPLRVAEEAKVVKAEAQGATPEMGKVPALVGAIL
jgi:hypothetical protein